MTSYNMIYHLTAQDIRSYHYSIFSIESRKGSSKWLLTIPLTVVYLDFRPIDDNYIDVSGGIHRRPSVDT